MKTVFVASYLTQDMYLYLYLYVLFVSWGNEFCLQPHFSSLGYEVSLLGVLSVVTPTRSIAKLPGTSWSGLVFVLFSWDSVYCLKEDRRKTRCCLLISAQPHLNSSWGTSVVVQNLCPGTPVRVSKGEECVQIFIAPKVRKSLREVNSADRA